MEHGRGPVFLDPLTEPTQRVAPLLLAVRDRLKLPLHIIFIPRLNIGGEDSIPITSYYRFIADPDPLSSFAALFHNLPIHHVLTLRMDVPPQWNVQQSYAIQDTDNLRCDLGCGDYMYQLQEQDEEEYNVDEALLLKDQTKIEYTLNGLFFGGQCYNTTGDPPNGLQLTLNKVIPNVTTASPPDSAEVLPDGSIIPSSQRTNELSSAPSHFTDTLVMKNLGYWQLRAKPGIWEVNIAENSNGAKIFRIVDGRITPNGAIKMIASSDSFTKKLVMKDFLSPIDSWS